MIDTLTNLPNQEDLEKDLKENPHPKLFILDISNFKQINLTYSDIAGDFVLNSFAKALESFGTFHELKAYRLEADKFALLANIPFELAALEKLVTLITQFTLAQRYTFEENTFDIEVKMGISLDHFDTFKKALKALELAKKEKQPFVTYSQFALELLSESEEEKYNYIKKSINDKKILPFYQPIVDTEEKRVFYEALIRIEGPDGIQSPKFFLNLAHQKGLYTTIIKELSFFIKKTDERVSMNLSCNDFEDEELFTFLLETFTNSNTIFELQNDTFFQNLKDTQKLHQLKHAGIKLCLDNVQHSHEIQHIQEPLFDFLKVHGDIIRLLPLGGREYALAKEIIKICNAKKIFPIAAHVNSQASFESAKEIGFKAFQGFFFGKPSVSF
jgi:EAL domain-containing protein (putative c-di-GMP-specific phosphodiesterase class I)/GGDEF domain-containing protein